MEKDSNGIKIAAVAVLLVVVIVLGIVVALRQPPPASTEPVTVRPTVDPAAAPVNNSGSRVLTPEKEYVSVTVNSEGDVVMDGVIISLEEFQKRLEALRGSGREIFLYTAEGETKKHANFAKAAELITEYQAPFSEQDRKLMQANPEAELRRLPPVDPTPR